MATRKKPTIDDRIAEYVDSPRMIYRIRQGKRVAARILGNCGEYQTEADVGADEVTGCCSCPSEYQPCKHIHAVLKTWDDNPKSFFNLDQFATGLKKQSNEYLINSIEQIAMKWPEVLSVFGVPGFDADPVEEDDEDSDW